MRGTKLGSTFGNIGNIFITQVCPTFYTKRESSENPRGNPSVRNLLMCDKFSKIIFMISLSEVESIVPSTKKFCMMTEFAILFLLRVKRKLESSA